ncbi:SDR family NAD(P)-dependent oxidoreductase [Amycolatopsis sp. lyj-90]|uniref:SDR family NAD(P)-dependent oxidoreductase n=1 Tax=Amycolatopsis sp. lyj-90 TaxID=2789285 RepID=UPI00397E38EE
MDNGLSRKRVLVTGGSRGIGRAITLAFARDGAHVVACHREPSEEAAGLTRELKELSDRNRVVQADLTTSAGAQRLAGATQETLGGLDVLVNNVGVDGMVPFDRLGEDEWRRVMEHNVTTAYLVTHASLGLLTDGASIVNVGASVALRGRPGGVHYTASKAALIGLTRGLCKDLGSRGIRVNLVAPGLTETEPDAGLPPQLVERMVGMTALGRLCQPDDVAGAVLFLAGENSRYVTGTTLTVDGGV